MIPTILQLGPLAISTFGLILCLAFFLGSFLLWQKGREEYFDEEALMDGIILTALIGLLGARLWYVLLHWSGFGSLLGLLDLIQNPGFSWHGALIAGTFAFVLFGRKQKWDFYKLADLSVFGLVLGLILAKIGQFLAEFIFAGSQQFFPLYEVVLYLGLYRLLMIFDKNYRTYEWYKTKRGESKPGFLFLAFMSLTAFIRIMIGIIRNPLHFFYDQSLWVDAGLIFLCFLILPGRRGKDLTSRMPWVKKVLNRIFGRKKSGTHFKAGLEARE